MRLEELGSRCDTILAWGCAVVGAQRTAPLRLGAHAINELTDSRLTA